MHHILYKGFNFCCLISGKTLCKLLSNFIHHWLIEWYISIVIGSYVTMSFIVINCYYLDVYYCLSEHYFKKMYESIVYYTLNYFYWLINQKCVNSLHNISFKGVTVYVAVVVIIVVQCTSFLKQIHHPNTFSGIFSIFKLQTFMFFNS